MSFRDSEVEIVSGAYDADGHVKLSLGLYVMRVLPDDLATEVEAHLECCEWCREESQSLQQVIVWLASARCDGDASDSLWKP